MEYWFAMITLNNNVIYSWREKNPRWNNITWLIWNGWEQWDDHPTLVVCSGAEDWRLRRKDGSGFTLYTVLATLSVWRPQKQAPFT